ncbi:MAG: beta-lactamase family protein [Cephaloticoccus sp.]|nr:beta-lactamase family protein [Cephaloticoccus sp.]MCF7760247.1 beta-lactamase family protein [Cephaloticoccus sp.]
MKRFLIPALFFCAFSLGSALISAPLPPGDAVAAGLSPEGLEQMHAVVQDQVDRGRYAGVITLIARHGKIVDARSYGSRDLATQQPMERDSLIYVYSLTKVTIAVTVLGLWEEGRFKLDDPIADYLPEFKAMQVLAGGTSDRPELVPARPITIRHLLTHTAGFAFDFTASPALRPYYERTDLSDFPTLPEFARTLVRLPLDHQPGDAFTYGVSYDVLGYLIERLTGQPLETVMRSRVFAPLGMNDTWFVVPPEQRQRLARVHERGPTGRLEPTKPETFVLGATGAKEVYPNGSGGLVSTVDDFARFAQMLLNGGELDGVRVLAPATVRLMTTDQLTHLKTPATWLGPDRTYGLGLGVWPHSPAGDTPGLTGRYGWEGGATTYLSIDPGADTIAMIFAQHFPYNEFGLFEQFSAAFYQSLVRAPAH